MQPLNIICGHYGSGKTECAVSLAILRAGEGIKVALADLDIVNPYFRSRERAQLLEQHGVQVISSSLGHVTTTDLPAVSPAIRGPLHDPEQYVILDVGGDSVGAKVLVSFVPDIRQRPYELLLVVNAYRPDTRTVEGVLSHLKAIEETSGLKFTGFISNTHALRETSVADVLTGYELTKAVSERTELPVCYLAAFPQVLAELPAALDGEGLPIGFYMRDEWM